MRTLGLAAALSACLFLVACDGGGAVQAPVAEKSVASEFQKLEADLLVPKCVRAGCHGGGKAAGGLDLSQGVGYQSLVGVNAKRRPQKVLVVPGDPDASYLVERLIPGGDRPLMPLGASALSEAELEALRAWIRNGAKP